MKRSAPRRVLKSVVGPALGTTLAALLAIVPLGCDDPRPTVSPDPTPTQHDKIKVGKTGVTEPSPDVAASTPPTIPDPGKQIPPVGKPVPPPVGAAKAPIPKVGKSIPMPGKTAMPKPGPAPTESFPKVGMFLQDDDHTELRPTRARRRVTDPTYQAMSGSGPRRLA